MIFYDVTNSARASHHSGLQRVSRCLRATLDRRADTQVRDVEWTLEGWRAADGGGMQRPGAGDWLLTPELFSAEERPGFSTWLDRTDCGTAAIYYDAIPLKFPAITWPKSVGRHPGYLKQLARFERVLAISNASRAELAGYWDWLRVPVQASLRVIPLGADGGGVPRAARGNLGDPVRALLMVGIVEPRKNQDLMIDVCEQLWDSGLDFELHIVGRTNPHFGRPVVQRALKAARNRPGLRFHGALDDGAVETLRERCRAAVFPSIAEGNGLPLIEALWRGLPCVCSDIPALGENAAGGGCVVVPVNDNPAWAAAVHEILTNDSHFNLLRSQALARPLPTWDDTARAVLESFSG